MLRYKSARFLIVIIPLLLILSSTPVLAQDWGDSDAEDWFSDLSDAAEDLMSDDNTPVLIDPEGDDSGALPFEDYNAPPETSGSPDHPPDYHPICPCCVGDLVLELREDTRVIEGIHTVECWYVGYEGGRREQASFTIAWAEDRNVTEGIAKQLCWPDFLGWDEWWESDMAVSVPNVYLHDDKIALKDELKAQLKEALARAEARAISCAELQGGGDDGGSVPSGTEDTSDEDTTPPQDEFMPSGPFNSDCSINQEEFDRDWLKYSDFDEAIPLEERSWEAKQYHDVLDQATELMLEAYLLDRDMEIDRLMRLELKGVRDALGKNLKQNLIKSFIRLAWLTYDTVKPAVGRGTAYARVLTEADMSGLQQVVAITNFVRDNIPENSTIVLDTQTARGKFMTVGAKGILDAMDAFGGGNYSSLGNMESASKVASGLFGESVKQAGLIPAGPKLTDEDFALLADQFNRTRVLDTVLAESYRVNAERRDRINQIEVEVARLRTEADDWESKEKERVQRILEDDCRQQKKRFEEEQ